MTIRFHLRTKWLLVGLVMIWTWAVVCIVVMIGGYLAAKWIGGSCAAGQWVVFMMMVCAYYYLSNPVLNRGIQYCQRKGGAWVWEK
jgi:hypothetical protein